MSFDPIDTPSFPPCQLITPRFPALAGLASLRKPFIAGFQPDKSGSI
jgi:hypothetical protein